MVDVSPGIVIGYGMEELEDTKMVSYTKEKRKQYEFE
tara:strand:- start:65280 stop:65390 length:111 start_codon:yes stop_codon:yes gene_type:complete